MRAGRGRRWRRLWARCSARSRAATRAPRTSAQSCWQGTSTRRWALALHCWQWRGVRRGKGKFALHMYAGKACLFGPLRPCCRFTHPQDKVSVQVCTKLRPECVPVPHTPARGLRRAARRSTYCCARAARRACRTSCSGRPAARSWRSRVRCGRSCRLQTCCARWSASSAPRLAWPPCAPPRPLRRGQG